MGLWFGCGCVGVFVLGLGVFLVLVELCGFDCLVVFVVGDVLVLLIGVVLGGVGYLWVI